MTEYHQMHRISSGNDVSIPCSTQQISTSQKSRQRPSTPSSNNRVSEKTGEHNPDQPTSNIQKARQRSPTPPGRSVHHCNPPTSTRHKARQRSPTPPCSKEAALLQGNQQISPERRTRQRSPSPLSSKVLHPNQRVPTEGNRNYHQRPELSEHGEVHYQNPIFIRGRDPFGIENPSDKDSLSTISSTFIRKLSRIYKWLRRVDASPPLSISAGNEETYNRDNDIQRTPNPPRRRVLSLSIENQSIRSDDIAKRRKLKICLVILLALVVSCVAISGVIVLVSYFKDKENIQTVTDGGHVFSGLLKVNETFYYEMADSNSPKFQSFEERFCSNIESVLIQNVSSGRCKINSLSNGSIIVNFTLVISDHRSVNQTQDLLICLFNGTQVGAMTVDSRATRFTFNPDGNGTIISKELKSSSCSSDLLPILPMDYTYPDYCGDYRVCTQGNSVLETCPQGQEFAYLLQNDTVICAPPSNNTYCGKIKSGMENTTSRLSSLSSVTDSELEVILSTNTSRNTLAYATSSSFSTTTTTTTAMEWPNVFTCSSSYAFLPANDTYPDNCGKYQECIGGNSTVRLCAEGSNFVYSPQNSINACHGADDPLTYCNMMKFFKAVCSENPKYFVTTKSQDEAPRIPPFP